MNSCNFIGRLGKDWQTSYSSAGKCVAKNTMAVKKYNNETLWINIVSFGKQGETLSQHTGKGSELGISSSFESREYEKDGIKKYFSEFIVNQFTFVGGKGQNQQNNQNQGYQNQGQQQGYQQQNRQQNQYDAGSDIPF